MMPDGGRKRLGKLELQVMKIVWRLGRATVRQVWEALYAESDLAYTTVATVIRNVEEKGFVAHEVENRTYVYYPLVEQAQVSRSMVRDLVEHVFDGSPTRLVSALIADRALSDTELAQLEELVHQQRRSEDHG